MDIARKNTIPAKPFFLLSSRHGVLNFVARCSLAMYGDARVMEAMPANDSALRSQQAVFSKRHGYISELHQVVGHLGRVRQYTGHWICLRRGRFEMLRQIEHATTLRIDGFVRNGERAHLIEHRLVST